RDPAAQGRLAAGAGGEAVERLPNERVLAEAVDTQLGRGLELDPVDETESLVDGEHLVLAVGTDRPHHEAEVDLRRRGRSHPSASVSATNSGGASASARMSAARPIVASAST